MPLWLCLVLAGVLVAFVSYSIGVVLIVVGVIVLLVEAASRN